jgi:hypothetical protein
MPASFVTDSELLRSLAAKHEVGCSRWQKNWTKPYQVVCLQEIQLHKYQKPWSKSAVTHIPSTNLIFIVRRWSTNAFPSPSKHILQPYTNEGSGTHHAFGRLFSKDVDHHTWKDIQSDYQHPSLRISQVTGSGTDVCSGGSKAAVAIGGNERPLDSL